MTFARKIMYYISIKGFAQAKLALSLLERKGQANRGSEHLLLDKALSRQWHEIFMQINPVGHLEGWAVGGGGVGRKKSHIGNKHAGLPDSIPALNEGARESH